MIELFPFVTVEVIQGTSRNGHMVIQMCHNEDIFDKPKWLL